MTPKQEAKLQAKLEVLRLKVGAELPVGTVVCYWPMSGPYFHGFLDEQTRVDFHNWCTKANKPTYTVTAEPRVVNNNIWVSISTHGFVPADGVEPWATYLDPQAHHKWITKFSRP